MIVVRLRGGLGNQLFQYAAAKALALHHHVGLGLDAEVYETRRKRRFELGRFAIADPVLTGEALVGARRASPRFVQPHFHFCERFFELPPSCYLVGYWQSERYFVHVRRPILDALSVPEGRGGDDGARLRDHESVSVHVRRGDYVSDAAHAQFFGFLGLGYYRTAMARLRGALRRPRFHVFSDDPAWCAEAFRDEDDVELEPPGDAVSDLIRMSQCRHHIIANSSFSWWGAWLNENPSKIVIAPKPWFRQEVWTSPGSPFKDRRHDVKDVLPPGWIAQPAHRPTAPGPSCRTGWRKDSNEANERS